MDLSNDTLIKMYNAHEKYNRKYKGYYYRMSKEYYDKSYLEKARKIDDCCNLWLWDAYHLNKTLDLKKVNRCKDNRFCPNCKKMDTSKFIHRFKEIIADFKEYSFYFMTLTVPSCDADTLSSTIDKINDSFMKFKNLYSYELLTKTGRIEKRAWKDRLIKLEGGLRVLEVTYNDSHGYHPHLHCLVLTKKPIPRDYLEKTYQGRYSKKRKQIDRKNQIEVQIGKLWSMIWNNEVISEKRYNEIEYVPSMKSYEDEKPILEVDFQPFSEKGIYEVIKYTCKDTDIKNYEIFKTLHKSLKGRRIRQGFGCLYNVKVEDIDDIGEQQQLELEIDEEAEELLTKGIKLLFTQYKEYKKVSRYNTQIDDNIK